MRKLRSKYGMNSGHLTLESAMNHQVLWPESLLYNNNKSQNFKTVNPKYCSSNGCCSSKWPIGRLYACSHCVDLALCDKNLLWEFLSDWGEVTKYLQFSWFLSRLRFFQKAAAVQGHTRHCMLSYSCYTCVGISDPLLMRYLISGTFLFKCISLTLCTVALNRQ